MKIPLHLDKMQMRKLLGPARRELSGQEYEEIRLILKFLEPYETNNSFHCWSERYRYNDKIYQLVGEISSPDASPIIEELEQEYPYDK